MKIGAQIKKVNKYLRKRFSSVEFTYGDVLSRLVMLVIIFALSVNIYTAFNKGQENLLRIEEEEAKLAELQEQQAELEDLVTYYESIEYRQSYARESWNLAEPGETLYHVVRDDTPPIEYAQENDDPIILRDNGYWWQKLLLGI